MVDFEAEGVAYLELLNKFWLIQNTGHANSISYGKLVNGAQTHVKTGTKEYLSQQDAVMRARSLIKEKTDRGYALPNQAVPNSPAKTEVRRPSNGSKDSGNETVLERTAAGRTEYVKLTAKGMILEVEKGVDRQRQTTQGTHHNTQAELEAEAKSITRKFISKGFKRVSTFVKSDTEVEEVVEVPKLPRKRPRTSDEHESLQAMLDTIGLGRYVLAFETKRIGIDAFLRLNDQELTGLGVPVTARRRILSSIRNGRWEPNTAVDSDSEVEVLGDRMKNSFIIEKGKSKPPKDISVMLAQTWDDRDPTGWWMSEKLDGVRCYWNGKTLKSRNGNEYMAPDFFLEGFPKTVSLDGELWTGRKRFSECVSIVRKTDAKHDYNEWRKVIYVLFDAPSLGGKFETRLKYLEGLAKTLNSPYIRAHEHVKCEGREHIERELKRVEELGGEGVMLREPGSNYDNFRSWSLLKVKTFYDDEAVVIGHEEGKGRNQGVMGALRVRGNNGIEFKVGSGFTDQERRRPPKIGTRITYKYQELTKDGKPRFPTYLREHPGL
mmetsp:Transcript_24193/g.42992  ORF Transcript_24193/g.42992 Transcript_24193/m.42992 type:complete len:549 (-) Transcript_24193:206-1852(-)